MEVSTLPRRGGGFLPHPRQVLRAFGDDRLVEQIRRGHDAAFEVAYERHHRGILSFCRHMLSSQEEAEDAVQQTFVSAYYDIRRSSKRINLKPWLYTIARNRCLTVLRARREQPAELEDVPTAGLSEEVQQRDDLRRMLADLHGLPVEQRAALVLSELGDLSHPEIADILGCPALKVKSLVFQARSALIESREAREIPCVEIREQLSTLRGGALRRGHLRRHVSACPGCAEFRDEVRRQRAAVAAILPVIPTAGLKGGVMAATGIGGGAGGAAAGLASGGGGVMALCSGGAAKLAAVTLVAAGTVGAGMVVKDAVVGGGVQKAPASEASRGGPAGAARGAPASRPMQVHAGAGGAALDRGTGGSSSKAAGNLAGEAKSGSGAKAAKHRHSGTGSGSGSGSPSGSGTGSGSGRRHSAGHGSAGGSGGSSDVTKGDPAPSAPSSSAPAAPATPSPTGHVGGRGRGHGHGGGDDGGDSGLPHRGNHGDRGLPGGGHDGHGDGGGKGGGGGD
jgi:RNA polymerase sigma factor (sigma-70 family)